jgi:hypothetical protein
MSDTVTIVIVLAALVAVLFAAASPISAALVGNRARRLPTALALRMEEEWLSELNSISSRPGKLAFAVALILTRRRAFVAPGEIIVSEIAAFGSRKSLVILSTLVFAVATYGVASFLMPVQYESQALLLSKDQEELVLRQAHGSSLLASVVDELPKLSIEELRNNVTVTPLPSSSGTLFLLKYRAPDPDSAQLVTATLTKRLFERETQFRIDRAHDEERFLRGQLERLGDEIAVGTASSRAGGGKLALDHELQVASYKALFARHQDAKMAASLQRAQLAVVEPPEMGKPVGPNRIIYAVIGGLAGFLLAVMAVVSRRRRQPPALRSPA